VLGRLTHSFSKHIYPSSSHKHISMSVRFRKEENEASMLNFILPGCGLCHLYEVVDALRTNCTFVGTTWWKVTTACAKFECVRGLVRGVFAANHSSIRCLAQSTTWTQISSSFCQSLRLWCFQRLHNIAISPYGKLAFKLWIKANST